MPGSDIIRRLKLSFSALKKTEFSKLSLKNGFTLIELLIVVSIVGIMLSIVVPISFNMYESHKAAVKAQDVMVFISGLRREAFLYSEGKVLSSKNYMITIDGKEKVFTDTLIEIKTPITFYGNGTTSGGAMTIIVGNQSYSLQINPPLGDLLLSRTGSV